MTQNQCRCVSVCLGCRVVDADEAMHNRVRLVLDDGVQLEATLCGCPRKTKRSCLITNNANLTIHGSDEREHQVACKWRPWLGFYQA